MKKEQLILIGILFFIFFLSVQADVCDNPTLIYGKVYFEGYYDNSQVINATVEVWNSEDDYNNLMLSYAITDTNGNYLIDISKNMTSLNQTFYVKAKWSGNGDVIRWDYKKVNISCTNPKQVNFKVQRSCMSPPKISGAIKKKLSNGTTIDAQGENTSIVLNFFPKGSGNFIPPAIISYPNSSGSTTVYNVGMGKHIFYIQNTKYSQYSRSWPTDLLVSMNPFNGHYYRYRLPFSNNTLKYLNISIKCGDELSADFFVFDRKNVSENCSYDDECLSNNCYKKICMTSCMRGNVNGDASVDIFDVVEILQYLAYGTNIKEECADMDEDDIITILDALSIISNL